MFGDKRSDRIQVKICGITNLADALAAIDCGADALGFNFYPGSKRYIEIETARDWIDMLPGSVCKVAVLVDPSLDEAIRVNELRFIDALQLHGQESPEFGRTPKEWDCSPKSTPGMANSRAAPGKLQNECDRCQQT